jgi:hypothetical protein
MKAYAIFGRKHKIVGKGKNEREVLGKEHIIYTGDGIFQTDCSCGYAEDVFHIFKTKSEAERIAKYPPFPYRRENVTVKRITIN